MIGKSKNQIRQRALEAIREQQQKAQMQAVLLGTYVPVYMDPEEVMRLRERETQNREDIERARREDSERELVAQITENARRNLNMDWGLNGARDALDMSGNMVVWSGRRGAGRSVQQQLEQEYARHEEERREQERQVSIQRLREIYSNGFWWDEPAQEQMQQPEPEPVQAIAPKPRPVVKVTREPRRIRV